MEEKIESGRMNTEKSLISMRLHFESKNHPDASIKEILQETQRGTNSEFCITPSIVLDFVREIIIRKNCKQIYIPYSRGIEIDELRNSVETIDYNIMNRDLEDFVQKKTGIACALIERVLNTKYDVIYSDLPFESFNKNCTQRKIVDESIKRLSQNGIGIFTFPSNIVYGMPAKKWLNELASNGIIVSAIIDLSEGQYYPMTSISTKILVFSKEGNEKVFLAKIRKESDISVIVDNYLKRNNSSKAEALGKWFERDSYPDYTTYENDQRCKRIAAKLEKAYNGKMVPLSQICTSVHVPRKSEETFIEQENAVYIPRLGKSKVVTSLNDLQIKPQNYFQIIVEQDRILPEFLAFILNTDSGVEIRVRASGGFIPSLSVERIKKMEVPIPVIKMQAEVLNILSELNQIELETLRLKDKLESIPAAYSNIAKDIKEINNRGDKFEQWIESLPYPLATILKRYSTADTNHQKQDMLLYFFEAYSIFVAAILTAIFQQPQLADAKIEDVGVDYFEKASFGSWVKMDRAFTKIIRVKMDDPKMIDIVLNCFHTDDQSLVKTICQGDGYSILQRTCDYRNSWKGHSGITSETGYTEHVRILEGELFKLQEKLKDLYEKIRLIRPISLKHCHGEFINKVEILTGSNAIFKKEEIIGEPLDEDKLYIQVYDTKDTFEIPPYFIMKNSPSDVKNACYFYNRIEGSKSRYVSYHFEDKPENTEEGEVAFDIIKGILNRNISKLK